MQIYIDGHFCPESEARISVFDHGLLYGDGVFEGLRIYNRRIFEFDAHMQRLYDSARAIALEVPLVPEELREAVLECVRRNEIEDGYVRLVVTRGQGDLGLNPVKCHGATVIIIAATIQLYPEEMYDKGLKLITCSTRRSNPQVLNPAIKSLNYLNNIMGALELRGTGAQEGLMLTQEGYIAECTADNFFLVVGRRVMTPSIAVGALPGITRGVVLELARNEMGCETEEGFYTLYDVYRADEAFVTGTAAEIVPAVEIDRRKIGDGSPGPVTRELMDRFRTYTQTSGTPVYLVQEDACLEKGAPSRCGP